MIWIRFIFTIIALLLFIYFAMLLLQCFGFIQFTNRKITFARMIVPFYYWIAPTNEKPQKQNRYKKSFNEALKASEEQTSKQD